MDASTLYQDLIIDHGTLPRNFSVLEGATHTAQGFNPLCGDKLELYLLIADERIQAASFKGEGCAICTASASLMTEKLQGLALNECEPLFNTVIGLLTEDSPPPSHLGKLLALANVKTYPSRVKCAALAWHTLTAALKSETQAINTESL